MARKGGSKEGFSHDPSINMPSEQRTSESNKQKISRIHDMFPNAKKEHIAVILQFYDDDESKAIDAITRDGGREALSHVTETGSLKNKNNKNKKKKKKPKKDVTGMATTASFDADDSSSLHSSGNVDADIEKECQRVENGNGFLTDVVDEVENLNTTLTNHERLKDNEPESLDTRSAISTPECDVSRSVTTTIFEKSNAMQHKQDSQSTPCGSPLSDYSEKQEELKKDRNKSVNEHYKQTSRQRTSSFRRSKTSSLSEDSSSQHNPPNTAANKRGIEKCKKDLNRQTVSLQRIHSQVEKGLEESAKKIKNVFGELQKLIENRRKEVESELEKRKEEALNLIKSRQDLAVELKRRVDRSPSMTDNEWMDLRTDIKLFVTERKYDEDFGKTIWFQWADISDSIKSFGEVQPVKNVYSQRSNSVLTNRETSQSNHPEPSPSSSLANEDIDSAGDKNDVAVIADAVEDESLPPKEEAPSINKNRPHDNKTYDRVYSSKRFGRYNNRFQNNRGNFRGSRGGGYTRPNYNRNNYTNYRHNNYYDDYRGHTHQEREGRSNENQSYSGNERNNNYKDNKNNPGRGHSNYRYNNHRFKEYPGHRNNVDNANLTESSTKPMDVNAGKSSVVNGIENN